MISVVILDKSGSDVRVEQAVTVDLEASLYKKCGFRKLDNFSLRHTFPCGDYKYEIWGKNKGRGTINKTELPPPIDKETLYGDIAVVKRQNKRNNSKYMNLTKAEWTKVYEKLFGGFEELEDEEEDDEEEDEAELTKHGYKKDDFIAEEDDEEEDDDDEDEDDDDEDEDDEEEPEEEDPEEEEEDADEDGIKTKKLTKMLTKANTTTQVIATKVGKQPRKTAKRTTKKPIVIVTDELEEEPYDI